MSAIIWRELPAAECMRLLAASGFEERLCQVATDDDPNYVYWVFLAEGRNVPVYDIRRVTTPEGTTFVYRVNALLFPLEGTDV